MVSAVLDVLAQPREIIQIDAVNLIKMHSTICYKLAKNYCNTVVVMISVKKTEGYYYKNTS